MSHSAHGVKHGFLSALNRCVPTSFFFARHEARKNEKISPAFEVAPSPPRNLTQERYLAIPTFIRQGKILGL